MKFKALLLGILMVAGPAFGADIDGNWTGSVDTPNGPVQVDYTFKAAGNTLTGSTKSPDGMLVNIKDGHVDGSKISFTVELDLGGQVTTFKYTGTLNGDALALTADFMGQPLNIALKKAK